jgi:hypothetical protein
MDLTGKRNRWSAYCTAQRAFALRVSFAQSALCGHSDLGFGKSKYREIDEGMQKLRSLYDLFRIFAAPAGIGSARDLAIVQYLKCA